MAIAVEVTFSGEGATLENYLSAIREMGTDAEGSHPHPGCLFHWVTQTDDGLRVTDVWMSQEEFESFAREQIGPAGEKIGLPQPQTRFIDVSNYLTAG